MSPVQEKKLGEKYVLLDRIGIGGMAEIYRSKLIGDKGFEKQIVIKKLLSQFAQDKEMVRLFIGEARLAALLQHENIAATYDFGEIDGNFYLAMEYLSGKDLYTVLQKTRERENCLEIKHALLIASKICEGMDYAHRLKDLQGKPLNIIHRDLTPHNIFITYDGKVKIFDFGVAKAEMLDNKTRAGVVKGKLSYMSPEQLSGEAIDFRSDVFSIGILLYEMLSGQRMYSGDTATLIKKCITVDYEHLENIVPDLPPELHAILHKALARDVEARYQSCADMQADIDDLMFSMAERQDSKSLQNYIRSLFANEFESDQEEEVSFIEKTVALNTGQDCKPEAQSSLRRLLDSLPWNDKRFILITSVCLVALIAFLLPGLLKKDNAPVPPPPVNQEIIPQAESLSNQGAARQLPQQDKKGLSVNGLPKVQESSVKREDEKSRQERLKKEEEKLREAEKRQQERLREAKKSLKPIGDSYANQVEKALAAGRIADAEKLIDIGLSSEVPQYDRLLGLKTRIEEKKKAIIHNLDKMARQRLYDNKLTTPTGDSAYYFYNEIMKMDPGSMLAQDGFKAIADRYVSLADKAYRKFDLAAADVYVRRGLQVMPDHARLQKLKADLSKSPAEKIFKGVEKNLDVLGKNIEGLFSN